MTIQAKRRIGTHYKLRRKKEMNEEQINQMKGWVVDAEKKIKELRTELARVVVPMRLEINRLTREKNRWNKMLKEK